MAYKLVLSKYKPPPFAKVDTYKKLQLLIEKDSLFFDFRIIAPPFTSDSYYIILWI